MRECDCPSWAIRCAHIADDVILILEDDALPGGCPNVHVTYARFAVSTIIGYEPCDCGCGEPKYVYETDEPVGFDDYEHALAAFYAHEEALLNDRR